MKGKYKLISNILLLGGGLLVGSTLYDLIIHGVFSYLLFVGIILVGLGYYLKKKK